MPRFEPSPCPRCGTVGVDRTKPLGLCPACLLTTALSIEDDPCPYQVVAPMGEDSKGVTYLALALNGSRGYVALKVHGSRDDAEAVLSRYQRWKPALARVQHPGIGRLLEVGRTSEGLLYVASEYVAGWPLTALSSRSPVGLDRTEIARQLTGAIDAAHAAGIVHLKLEASKIKISTANTPHATILGLGTAVILEGVDGPPDVDRAALTRIIQELGIEP